MVSFGTLNGEHESDEDCRCQNCDFGSHFGGPGPLKSTPKCEIMDLESTTFFILIFHGTGTVFKRFSMAVCAAMGVVAHTPCTMVHEFPVCGTG